VTIRARYELFYRLGRYDVIMCHEAGSVKVAMGVAMLFAGKATTETSVAIPVEEARGFLKKHTDLIGKKNGA
jgi:uncharacterized protein with GYD domain